jgi:hypothetical protein
MDHDRVRGAGRIDVPIIQAARKERIEGLENIGGPAAGAAGNSPRRLTTGRKGRSAKDHDMLSAYFQARMLSGPKLPN